MFPCVCVNSTGKRCSLGGFPGVRCTMKLVMHFAGVAASNRSKMESKPSSIPSQEASRVHSSRSRGTRGAFDSQPVNTGDGPLTQRKERMELREKKTRAARRQKSQREATTRKALNAITTENLSAG
jgi:hypothetical protein